MLLVIHHTSGELWREASRDHKLPWAARGLLAYLDQIENKSVIEPEILITPISPKTDFWGAVRCLQNAGYLRFETTADGYNVFLKAGPPSAKKPRKKKGDVEYTAKFEEFWRLYPRKTSKVDACESWHSKKCDEIADKVLASLKRQIEINAEQWTRENHRYCPYPTSWLNQMRWNDEFPAQDGGSESPNSFRCLNKTFDRNTPPQRSDFTSDTQFTMYFRAYNEWKNRHHHA